MASREAARQRDRLRSVMEYRIRRSRHEQWTEVDQRWRHVVDGTEVYILKDGQLVVAMPGEDPIAPFGFAGLKDLLDVVERRAQRLSD